MRTHKASVLTLLILLASLFTYTQPLANATGAVTEISFPDGQLNVRWVLTINHPSTVNCDDYYKNCEFDVSISKKWIQDSTAGWQGLSQPNLPLSDWALSYSTYRYPNIVDGSGKEIAKIWAFIDKVNKQTTESVSLPYSGPTTIKFGMAKAESDFENRGFNVTGQGSINLIGPTEEQKRELAEELERAQDWYEETENDGFTSYFQISKGTSNDTVRVSCEKRKLNVVVMTPYASSFGWKGSGQYKFDNKKPVKFTYTVSRNFRGVFLNNPKNFTSGLLKAKDGFSFKMSSVLDTYVFEHSKGNFADYVKKFQSLGCKL
jgi:hypothetical protein